MTYQTLDDIIDFTRHPLDDSAYIAQARAHLDETGVLCLEGFLKDDALTAMVEEAAEQAHHAYFTKSTHNVYLTPNDDTLGEDHVFNRQITSSKGCICTDQVPADSGLHIIYHDARFKHFISEVVGQAGVYPYADPL